MNHLELLHWKLQICEQQISKGQEGRNHQWWKRRHEFYSKALIGYCERQRAKLQDLHDTQPK